VIAIEVDPGQGRHQPAQAWGRPRSDGGPFEGLILRQPDDRFEYGEERWPTVGRIGDQVLAACYTMRGRAYRIISLRRASRKERLAYAQAYP